MSLKFDMEHGVQHHGNDNFHSILLRLMMKADMGNMARLARAFPNTAKVFKAWKDGEEVPDLEYD